MADKRRACSDSDQAGCEADCAAYALVRPLREEPHQAGGGKKRAATIAAMTFPEDEPGEGQAPAGRELGYRSKCRGAREGACRVMTSSAECEKPECDRQEQQREPNAPASGEPGPGDDRHIVIVSRWYELS